MKSIEPPRRAKRSARPLVILALAALVIGLVALNVRGARRAASNGANPADTQQVALGQLVYQANCASCHGAQLEGQPNWQQDLASGGRPAPPHDASGHTWHHNDQSLFATVKLGGQASSPAGYKNNMPAFGYLSDNDIWAVLAFIKSTWPAEIQQQQAQMGHE